MNCSRFETLLTDYMDRMLDAPVKTAVEEHLESCPGCRKLFEEVRVVRADLQSFPRAAPAGDLVQRILVRTSGLPESRSFWSDLVVPTIRPFMTQRFAFATGVMFVFLSLMVNLLGPGFSTMSYSDLSISEGGARIASQVSKFWNQVKDARGRAYEELGLWAEDISGRLDYHLITNLFKSYQETIEEQEAQIDEEEDSQEPAQSSPENQPEQ